MSTEPESKSPESELGLDLDLHFLPAWAQQSSNVNQYAKYTEGEDQPRERRGRPGRDRDRGPRRVDRPGDRPPREGRPRQEGNRGGYQQGRPQRGGQRPERSDRPERPPMQLPDLEVSFIPEDKGVESLARQIKLSGRAYPLFEIAYLVLKKPERYHVHLASKKKPEGEKAQLIYVCDLDETIWLNEDEAMNHVLDRHFSTFYATEKIPTDPPKGTYTFVAQCGMSGVILGPPNYHDYQNKLRKLHQERFSRLPFDVFKSRIKIVKDEAVVKKWLDEQSFRTEFTCLNIPETIKLQSREEVEKHFRQTHLPNVVKAVESYTLPGTAVANIQNRAIQNLIRRSYDDQMRFPLKVVNNLSQQFARQGLQFFKVNKSITHVAVARPRFLDMEATPVSEGVRKIVEFINSNPRSTRRKLIAALAPGAAQPAPVPQPAAEGAEGAPAQPPQPESPEVAAIISDLHWLIHQGHVIEFANGILETAKRPVPKPPRPARTPAQAEDHAASSGEASVEGEVAGDIAHEQASAETAPPSEESHSPVGEIQDERGASAGAQVVEETPSEQGQPEGTDQDRPAPPA